jgi:hypothetical protein
MYVVAFVSGLAVIPVALRVLGATSLTDRFCDWLDGKTDRLYAIRHHLGDGQTRIIATSPLRTEAEAMARSARRAPGTKIDIIALS